MFRRRGACTPSKDPCLYTEMSPKGVLPMSYVSRLKFPVLLDYDME